MMKLTLETDSSDILHFPVISSSLGPIGFDITQLSKHGCFAYDPGFMATAACQSKITYIDGEKGILLYRGQPIESLAARASYSEISHLLFHGTFPTTHEHQNWLESIAKCAFIPEEIYQLFHILPEKTHPMSMLMTAISMMSQQTNQMSMFHLIGAFPILMGLVYRKTQNMPLNLNPRIDLLKSKGYAAFCSDLILGRCDEIFVQAFDMILTLHADHEQNASTSTVRAIGSTESGLAASVVGGLAALWGSAHGGANEEALRMLESIGSEDRIAECIAKAKDPKSDYRLMGFGHRVYKNHDPRAGLMRKTCHQVLSATQSSGTAVFEIAKKLESIALQDAYFIQRKLYPNVDFYSGITLKALGFPISMFTSVFALGRLIGWISHWHEMKQGDFKLCRPRQIYTGPKSASEQPDSEHP